MRHLLCRLDHTAVAEMTLLMLISNFVAIVLVDCDWARITMRRVANNENSKLANVARQADRENLFVGFWLALLIGAGCWLLNALAESARRNECLTRGAAVCMNRSQPRAPTPAKRTGIAEYLKNSRHW
jgi:hypothetical protein